MDSNLSRFFAIYILASLETRAFIAFYPRSIPQFSANPNGAPARSRFFHVLPPGSDKSRYRPPPPTRFPARVGPRACILAGFLAGNSSGGRKNKKAGSKPGEIGSWKGLLYPGFTECERRMRRYAEILDYLSLKTSENCTRFSPFPSPPTVETTSPRMLAFRFIVENEIDSFFSNLFEISNII